MGRFEQIFTKVDSNGQTELDFEALEFKNILKKLDEKYPYAKPLVEEGEKGNFLVGENKKPMTLTELIEHYKSLNKIYRPDGNDSWLDK